MVGRPAAGLTALAIALAAFAFACGGGGSEGEPEASATPAVPTNGELAVRANEWSFEPSALLLTEGEEVRIQFQNDGRILHDLKIADMPADVLLSESTGPLEADEGDVFVGAEGGAGGTLVFVPLEAGSYAFYCTISGHRELGMEGTVTIQADPS